MPDTSGSRTTTIPRTRAGKFAPHTPQVTREITGYGAPVSYPISPEMQQAMKMMNVAMNTPMTIDKGVMPIMAPVPMNSPAAKV